MRKGLILAGGVALLLSATTVFAQSDYDDRWYVSGFGGFAELDSDRAGVDNSGIFGIGLGKFVSENVSLEIEADRVDADFSAPIAQFDTEFNAKSLGIFGRYHFLDPDSDIRPYFGFGIGGTYRDAFDNGFVPGDKDTSIYISPVVGLKFNLSDKFGARLQAAWRNDLGNETAIGQNRFNDFLFTAGVTYSFGTRTVTAPPAPTPPPPAPARPAPGPCDLDDDNDGVPNCRDKCANTCSGAEVDAEGCEVKLIIDLPNVNFAFDKAILTSSSNAILDDAAVTLQRHSRVNIEVAGHTDSIGTEAYNLDLSDRRSAVVRDYLIGKGVSAGRMASRGYGESRPVAGNDTSAGRAQNRRTELVITSGLSACK